MDILWLIFIFGGAAAMAYGFVLMRRDAAGPHEGQ